MIRIRRIQAPPLRTRRYEVEYRPADSSEAGWQLIGERKNPLPAWASFRSGDESKRSPTSRSLGVSVWRKYWRERASSFSCKADVSCMRSRGTRTP